MSALCRCLLLTLCCAMFSSAQTHTAISTFTITQLIGAVSSTPTTQPAILNSLTSKLTAAQRAYAAGNIRTAQNVLRAFTNELKAQAGKSISPPDANALLDMALQITSALSSGLKLGGVVLGPQGGVISVDDPNSPLHGLSIELPPSALDTDVFIGVSAGSIPAQAQLPDGATPLSAWVEIGPHDLSFAQPVTVRFPYDPAWLASRGLSAQSLGMLTSDTPGLKQDLISSTVNEEEHVVVATVAHFSFLGLFSSQHSWQLKPYFWSIYTVNYFVKVTRPQDSILLNRTNFVDQAFKFWETKTCGIRFQKVNSESDAQIVVQDVLAPDLFTGAVIAVWDYIRGDTTVLGYSTYPHLERALEQNDTLVVGLNSDVSGKSSAFMQLSASQRDAIVLQTLAHEIGHAIGIAHDLREGVAVMSTPMSLLFTTLQPDDIAAVQEKYGPSCPSFVVYDNGPHRPEQGGPDMRGQFLADDFSVPQRKTLTGVRFWSLEQPGAYAGSISWFVYADASGHPGALIASGNAADVNRAPTGTISIGMPEYLNTFSVGSIVVEGGKYWLALYNGAIAGPGGNGSFYVWVGTDANSTSPCEFQLPPGAPWATSGFVHERAFQVLGF